MKTKYILVLLILLELFAVQLFAQQPNYINKISARPVNIEKQGDMLQVEIKYTIDSLNLPTNKTIILTPTIVNLTNSQDLPQVLVKGQNSYKSYIRQESLKSKKQTQVTPPIVLKGGKKIQTISQSLLLPYQSWMTNGTLLLRYDICGCGDDPQMIITKYIATIKPSFTPYLVYVAPKSVTQNTQTMKEILIDFPVARTTINPDYMNNQKELLGVGKFIQNIQNTPNTTIDSILVKGYASPEGRLGFNQKLSQDRAKALAKYLQNQLNHSNELYKVSYGGENWDGLLEKVQNSQMPDKDRVIDILLNVPAEINLKTNSSRKKSLMDLEAGVPYNYMLKEYFPSLRTAECTVFYKTQITLDKQYEKLFLQAERYAQSTAEYQNEIIAAAHQYPNDDTANLNAATAALTQGDIEVARSYLAKIKNTNTAQYQNIIGCVYALQDNKAQAVQYFEQAARNGSEQASQNLKQL